VFAWSNLVSHFPGLKMETIFKIKKTPFLKPKIVPVSGTQKRRHRPVTGPSVTGRCRRFLGPETGPVFGSRKNRKSGVIHVSARGVVLPVLWLLFLLLLLLLGLFAACCFISTSDEDFQGTESSIGMPLAIPGLGRGTDHPSPMRQNKVVSVIRESRCFSIRSFVSLLRR
jgi:hypothetical protein